MYEHEIPAYFSSITNRLLTINLNGYLQKEICLNGVRGRSQIIDMVNYYLKNLLFMLK